MTGPRPHTVTGIHADPITFPSGFAACTAALWVAVPDGETFRRVFREVATTGRAEFETERHRIRIERGAADG